MQRTPAVSAANMFHFRVVAAALVLASIVGVGVGGCGSDPADGVQPGDGTALYAANCAICHGPDLRGAATGPSLLSSLYAPDLVGDEAIRDSVVSGVEQKNWEFGPMPMQPALSSAELDAIIAYVREVQQREGFEPYPPAP